MKCIAPCAMLVASLAAPSFAFAEVGWEPFVSSDNDRFYISNRSIPGEGKKLWVMSSIKPGKVSGVPIDGKPVKSTKALYEANCTTGKIQVIRFIAYGSVMGKGEPLGQSSASEPAHYPTPGTVAEAVYLELCPTTRREF